jgi:uncharacterized coiled-coil protein SlyX
MKLNIWKTIKKLEERIISLEKKLKTVKKYDEIEKRITALESKTRMFR